MSQYYTGSTAEVSSSDVESADVVLSFEARNLVQLDWLSKSDPEVIVCEEKGSDQDLHYLGETEWVKNDENPTWKEKVGLKFPGGADTSKENDRTIVFLVFDFDDPSEKEELKFGSKMQNHEKLIGRAEMSLLDFLNGTDNPRTLTLTNPFSAKINKKLGRKKSRIMVKYKLNAKGSGSKKSGPSKDSAGAESKVDNSGLLKQIAELQEQVKFLEGRHAALQGDYQTLDKEKGKLQKSLTSSEDKVSDLSKRNDAAAQEIAELEARLTASSAEGDSKLASVKAELTVAQSQVANLTTEVESLRSELTDGSARTDDLTKRLAAADLEAQKKQAALQTQLADAQQSLVASNAEAQQLTEANAALTAELAQVSASLDDCNQRTSQLTQALEDAEKSASDSQDQVHKRQLAQIRELEQAQAKVLAESEQAKSNAQGEIAQLQKQLTAAEAQIKVLRAELNSQAARADAAEHQNAELQAALGQLKNTQSRSDSVKQLALKNEQENAKRLQAELDAAIQNASNLETQTEALRVANARLRNTLQDTRSALSNAQDQLALVDSTTKAVPAQVGEGISSPVFGGPVNTSSAGVSDSSSNRERDYHVLFQWLDRDKSGDLSRQELRRFYQSVNADENDPDKEARFLSAADADSDDSVSFPEFCVFMDKLLKVTYDRIDERQAGAVPMAQVRNVYLLLLREEFGRREAAIKQLYSSNEKVAARQVAVEYATGYKASLRSIDSVLAQHSGGSVTCDSFSDLVASVFAQHVISLDKTSKGQAKQAKVAVSGDSTGQGSPVPSSPSQQVPSSPSQVNEVFSPTSIEPSDDTEPWPLHLGGLVDFTISGQSWAVATGDYSVMRLEEMKGARSRKAALHSERFAASQEMARRIAKRFAGVVFNESGSSRNADLYVIFSWVDRSRDGLLSNDDVAIYRAAVSRRQEDAVVERLLTAGGVQGDEIKASAQSPRSPKRDVYDPYVFDLVHRMLVMQSAGKNGSPEMSFDEFSTFLQGLFAVTFRRVVGSEGYIGLGHVDTLFEILLRGNGSEQPPTDNDYYVAELHAQLLREYISQNGKERKLNGRQQPTLDLQEFLDCVIHLYAAQILQATKEKRPLNLQLHRLCNYHIAPHEWMQATGSYALFDGLESVDGPLDEDAIDPLRVEARKLALKRGFESSLGTRGMPEDLWILFNWLDRDRSGSLSPTELRMFVKQKGAQGLKKLELMSDRNDDAEINFEEFCIFIRGLLRSSFDRMDENKDGNIASDEVARLFAVLEAGAAEKHPDSLSYTTSDQAKKHKEAFSFHAPLIHLIRLHRMRKIARQQREAKEGKGQLQSSGERVSKTVWGNNLDRNGKLYQGEPVEIYRWPSDLEGNRMETEYEDLISYEEFVEFTLCIMAERVVLAQELAGAEGANDTQDEVDEFVLPLPLRRLIAFHGSGLDWANVTGNYNLYDYEVMRTAEKRALRRQQSKDQAALDMINRYRAGSRARSGSTGVRWKRSGRLPQAGDSLDEGYETGLTIDEEGDPEDLPLLLRPTTEVKQLSSDMEVGRDRVAVGYGYNATQGELQSQQFFVPRIIAVSRVLVTEGEIRCDPDESL